MSASEFINTPIFTAPQDTAVYEKPFSYRAPKNLSLAPVLTTLATPLLSTTLKNTQSGSRSKPKVSVVHIERTTTEKLPPTFPVVSSDSDSVFRNFNLDDLIDTTIDSGAIPIVKPSILPYIDCGCLEVDQCGPPFGLAPDDPRMSAGYPRIYSKSPSCNWRAGRPKDTYFP